MLFRFHPVRVSTVLLARLKLFLYQVGQLLFGQVRLCAQSVLVERDLLGFAKFVLLLHR